MCLEAYFSRCVGQGAIDHMLEALKAVFDARNAALLLKLDPRRQKAITAAMNAAIDDAGNVRTIPLSKIVDAILNALDEK
jgi:hypothetical protein